MKYVALITSSALAIALIFILDQGFAISGQSIPPMGRLFNPASGFIQNKMKPFNSSTLELDVSDKAKIYFDNNLIPYIEAQSDEDLYYLQGYIHAKHRYWQMDFSSRVAAGRISEIVGPRALDFDRNKRTKGLAQASKQAVETWKKYPESYQNVMRYVDGVNAYYNQMSRSEWPIEYKLMNFKPEPWSAYKTSLLIRNMTDLLCSREHDFELTNARQVLGNELFNNLYMHHNPDEMPVIDKHTGPLSTNNQNQNIQQEATEFGILDRPVPRYPSGIGSNNWALTGNKSYSGQPLFSNDPHLPISLPSIWYLQSLKSPSQHVMGVTFAGNPGIVLGFNKDLAWGVTNAGIDVSDWTSIEWTDSTKTFYWTSSGIKEVSYRKEIYRVKGEEDIIDSIKITEFGPVFEGSVKGRQGDFAMRWLAHQEIDRAETKTFQAVNKASDLTSFLLAIDNFFAPAQNFAVATKQGDIAMNVQGYLPLRLNLKGKFLQKSSMAEKNWISSIPNDENPLSVNPLRGYVSSANQQSADSSYPYIIIGGDYRNNRGRTINLTLDTLQKATVQDMIDLQLSDYNIVAKDFLPKALTMVSKEYPEIELLQNWNYRHDSHSKGAVLFELWRKEFYSMVCDELETVTGRVDYPPFWRICQLIKEDDQHIIFDIISTPEKESAGDIIQLSFNSATQLYRKLQSENIHHWYQYRNSRINHMVSSLSTFGSDTLRCGGTGSAPNALRDTKGPSWRLIVDFDQPGRALGVYPGGQSGNPGSYYYDNWIPLYEKGEYLPLSLDPPQSENILFTLSAEPR